MDTHTDVPYFLHLQKQEKKLFFETTIAYTCYIKKPVVFQVNFARLHLRAWLFLFVIFFYAVFVLSSLLLHAHAMFYLINQVWLFSRVEFAA